VEPTPEQRGEMNRLLMLHVDAGLLDMRVRDDGEIVWSRTPPAESLDESQWRERLEIAARERKERDADCSQERIRHDEDEHVPLVEIARLMRWSIEDDERDQFAALTAGGVLDLLRWLREEDAQRGSDSSSAPRILVISTLIAEKLRRWGIDEAGLAALASRGV
jgi:hypothetical protein